MQTLARPLIDKSWSPVDQAYQYIMNGIVTGELAPGMRVPSESVAEVLGVSRMPVRDALRRLEGDGVVIISANRGASVAQYSAAEVVQLIEMRAALEGLAARLAIPNIHEAEFDELDRFRARMEKSAGSLSGWMVDHDAFHNYLTSLSHRPLLMKQTERMRLMLRPYYRRYYEQSHELEIVGLEHQKIIGALKLNDASYLEQIVRGHAMVNAEKIARFV